MTAIQEKLKILKAILFNLFFQKSDVLEASNLANIFKANFAKCLICHYNILINNKIK